MQAIEVILESKIDKFYRKFKNRNLYLLDVGGCDGINSLVFHNIMNITVIDRDRRCCDSFIKNLGRYNIKSASFILADFFDYNFRMKYDFIFSSHFLHLFDVNKMISYFTKVCSLLEKGGLSLNFFVSDQDKISTSSWDGSKIYKYSKSDIENIFLELQMKNINFEEKKIYYESIKEYDNKRRWHEHKVLIVEIRK